MTTLARSSHVSFSSLWLFDECMLRWRHRYDVAPIAKPLTVGMLIADVIEKYRRELYASGLDAYPGGIADIVQEVYAASDRVTSTEFFDDVMVAAKTFAKNFSWVPENVVEIEMQIEVSLGDGYPMLLSYVDCVERDHDEAGPFLLVTDDKSGWACEQTDRDRFQLHIYGWQLKQRYPDERIKTRNWFVRGEPTPPKEMMPWDFENVQRRCRAIVDRMEAAAKSGQYPAHPGKHCAYCAVAPKCAVLTTLQDRGLAAVLEGAAEEQLGTALVLEAALKQIKASLKSAVDAQGPVKLDDGTAAQYTFSSSQTLTDLETAYERLGQEMWNLVSVDSRKLKKYVDDPRVEDLIGTKPARRRFVVGEGGGEDE